MHWTGAVASMAFVSTVMGCGSTVTVQSFGEGGSSSTSIGVGGAGGTGGAPSTSSVGGSPAGMPMDCDGEWAPVPEPAPSDVTLEPIVPIWDQTGLSASNNSANNKSSRIRVGLDDGTNQLTMQGLITFELTALPPGAEVTSATLEVYQHEAEGEVYTPPMSTLIAESVAVASIWDASEALAEPELEPFVVSTTPVIDWVAVDVTSAVRRDLALCRTTTQLRMKFSPANEPESYTPSYIELVSLPKPPLDLPGMPKWPGDYAPRLTISYAAP